MFRCSFGRFEVWKGLIMSFVFSAVWDTLVADFLNAIVVFILGFFSIGA